MSARIQGTVRRLLAWGGRGSPLRGDLLLALALAALAGALCFAGASRVPVHLNRPEALDTWYDGDMSTVLGNMLSRRPSQGYSAYHTARHPVFALTAHLPVLALQQAPGVTPLAAVRLFLALTAAAWIAAFYLLLRLAGCRRGDAALFSAVAGVSAGAMFWFIVPESFPLGSLTLVLGLAAAALAQHRPVPDRALVVVSALTLSISTTNWMVGLAAVFAQRPWRRAAFVSAQAFLLVVLLWCAQKAVFRDVRLPVGSSESFTHTYRLDGARFLSVGSSLLAHTVIAPAPRVVPSKLGREFPPWLNVQTSRPGSGSAWGTAGATLWAVLLALGLWSLVSLRKQRTLRLVLGLALLGQLGFHLVFGDHTFLYAAHFLPLLVLTAALGTLTSARPVALALAAGLVVCAGIHNTRQLGASLRYVESLPVPKPQGPQLLGSRLRGADFRGADLRGADFYLADLRNASLYGADLQGAYLSRARLWGADLRQADLRGASLEGDLSEVRLEGARYDRRTRWPPGFDPAAAGAVRVEERLAGPPEARAQPPAGPGSPGGRVRQR
jgi:hypothetical protein